MIGILGTGELASHVVQGLCREDAPRIVVSPRNAGIAARLAADHGVAVGADDQAVVDGADLVFVCLPAGAGVEVLRGLAFRAGQSVCSAMAGVGLAAVAEAVDPARACLAMMPGAANRIGAGPCLLHPDAQDWHPVLSRLGPVYPVGTEAEFGAAAVFGALSGASFVLMQALADWFEAKGLAPDLARALVARTFAGNAAVLSASDDWDGIVATVATPGGITEALVARLRRDGGIESWAPGLDAIHARMTTAKTAPAPDVP